MNSFLDSFCEHDDNEIPDECPLCEIDKLQKHIKQLKEILSSYRIQAQAAMKAQSLGLCKKVISHAFTDEKKILEKKDV